MIFYFSDNECNYVLEVFNESILLFKNDILETTFGRTSIFKIEGDKINWDNGYSSFTTPEHVKNYFNRALKFQVFV